MSENSLKDAEFDRQYEDARTQPSEPLALEANYRAELGLVWIQLKNNCVFAFPPHLVEGLGDAPEVTLAEVEVLGGGCGLRWDSLDLDLSVTGLMMGSFGTRAWMEEIGRRGGQSTSDAKAEAARRNGRKGGRPPSKVRDERRTDPQPDSSQPEKGWLYWDSNEPPAGHSVGAAVVAGEQGQGPTTPGGSGTSRSSRTPSSRTPSGRAA